MINEKKEWQVVFIKGGTKPITWVLKRCVMYTRVKVLMAQKLCELSSDLEDESTKKVVVVLDSEEQKFIREWLQKKGKANATVQTPFSLLGLLKSRGIEKNDLCQLNQARYARFVKKKIKYIKDHVLTLFRDEISWATNGKRVNENIRSARDRLTRIQKAVEGIRSFASNFGPEIEKNMAQICGVSDELLELSNRPYDPSSICEAFKEGENRIEQKCDTILVQLTR